MDQGSHKADKSLLVNEVQNLNIDHEAHERSAVDLLKQCQSLSAELEQFQRYLIERKQETRVELRHFSKSVKAEFKLIQRTLNADPSAERTAHTLRSSNFPFYAAVWDAAKRCRGITALEKRFHWDPPYSPTAPLSGNVMKHPSSRHKRYSVMIDVIAQDGLEWVKVSNLTEKRILFDLAKDGWIEDSDNDSDGVIAEDDSDDEPEGLLKQAECLVKASKASRVRYKYPLVRIMLPRIQCGGSKVVDALLNKIRALGITVQTSEDIPTHSPTIAEALPQLAVNPFGGFSDTINVDCTILLALVSDLSHCRVEKEDWHHRAVLRQIEMEKDNQLLPNSLWPACGSRPLICTREAAIRMQEIVDLIGTESEKKRAECLMENASYQSRATRLQAFQELSEYAVPGFWQLPILAVDVDLPSIKACLPTVVEELSKSLSAINQSVFFYGWASGRTTISSNRVVAKEIEATIESDRTAESDRGPDIWISPASRSLVGKEKLRRN
ncbi:MAG: hypothetical protein M1818_002595 [Claussenomyces sp. TS43310]|nr:MAG: hypothetical protein M1818_002595 [Claussenomyces sp. TS43310]